MTLNYQLLNVQIPQQGMTDSSTRPTISLGIILPFKRITLNIRSIHYWVLLAVFDWFGDGQWTMQRQSQTSFVGGNKRNGERKNRDWNLIFLRVKCPIPCEFKGLLAVSFLRYSFSIRDSRHVVKKLFQDIMRKKLIWEMEGPCSSCFLKPSIWWLPETGFLFV